MNRRSAVREARMKSNFILLLLCMLSATSTQGLLTNVAHNKPASLSSEYTGPIKGPAGNGVDGNTEQNYNLGSCFHSDKEQSPSWTVDLQALYAIKNVKIYNRIDCCKQRANNLQLLIGDDINDLKIVGEKATMADIAEFQVNSDVGSQYVQLKINGRTDYLHLCEVEVYADTEFKNVASNRGQFTAMSAVYKTYTANLAVDGDRNGDFNMGSCFHTENVLRPFWRVDLGSVKNIAYVKVFNRLDCCTGRADGLELQLGLSEASLEVKGNAAVVGNRYTFNLNTGEKARYVKLQLIKATREYLHLCEVEVMSPRSIV